MFKQKVFIAIAAMTMLVTATIANIPASAAEKKRQATFKVRIENIATGEIETTGGSKYPFALSPGLFVVNHKTMYFFSEGKKADAALEAQAEDGNPELLSKKLLTKVGSLYLGIFNKPVGSEMPAPILPGGAYEFTFTAEEGMRLNLITMFGQSNDLFYSPKAALDLFDKNGNPLNGDITEQIVLWDAGTEKNQAPGVGDEQAPRQKAANTGTTENGFVGMVTDTFTYPNTKDVLKVTITAQ